jgi:hypothetical protein
VTAWTNAFLQPPPDHVFQLLGTAAAHQAVADRVAQGFADPVRFANALSSPESCAAFTQDALEPVAL